MSGLRLPAAVACSLLVVLLVAAPAVASARSVPVAVDVDRTEISLPLGGTAAFRSTIRNSGPATLNGLIAHLNVLSLRKGTYVDPEDWSSRRTRYLDPLPAGASTTITWHVHAVNGGALGLYVAVLPRRGAGLSPRTSPLIRLSVAEKQTLNTGGILPLVLGIPALIGLLTLAIRATRLRPRRASGNS